MRIWAKTLILLSALLTCASAQVNDPGLLKSLYDGHHLFELREMMQTGDLPLKYKAMVEYAFNDDRAESDILDISRVAPGNPEAEAEQYNLLLQLYGREGRYRETAKLIQDMFKRHPMDAGLGEDQALAAFLGKHNDQRIVSMKPRPLSIEFREVEGGGNIQLVVPLTVNGFPVNYILDSGAPGSTISESDAKELGMKVVENTSSSATPAGPVHYGSAMAQKLQVGGVTFENVQFDVMPDESYPFRSLPRRHQGVIGLEVLFALSHFQWNQEDRSFQVLPRSKLPAAKHDPNLAFDEWGRILIRVGIEKKLFAFVWDLGATHTEFSQSCNQDFPATVTKEAPQPCQILGGGGARSTHCQTGRNIPIVVGGVKSVLSSARIGTAQPFYDQQCTGVLGMDLLRDTYPVEVDFVTMTLQRQRQPTPRHSKRKSPPKH